MRLDVELAHPPERVWRALTDGKILSDWFMPTGLRPVPGDRFELSPSGQPGFDHPITGEVLEVDAPRRLAMRWRAPELDARVTFTIARMAGGCQVTLRQSGFFGMQGLLSRRVLYRTYTELLGRRLPEVLDRMADEEGRRGPVGAALARRRALRARLGEPPGRRNAARSFRRGWSGARRLRAVGRVRVSRPLSLEATLRFALPQRRTGTGSRGRRQRPSRWRAVVRGVVAKARTLFSMVVRRLRRPVNGPRGRAVLTAAGLLLSIGFVCFIVLAATALHPPAAPQVGGGGAEVDPGYLEMPGRRRQSVAPPSRMPASTLATVTAALSAAPPPDRSPDVAPEGLLRATYRTESARLGGYRGAVTIDNSGGVPVQGWTVVIMLPLLSLTISEATGAEYRQDGGTVAFTPTADTQRVGPGERVLFTFEVNGVGSPTGCSVEGAPCDGMPDPSTNREVVPGQ